MSCGVHEIPETWTSCPFCERVQERVLVEQIVSRWERMPHGTIYERARSGDEEARAEVNERSILRYYATAHPADPPRYALNHGWMRGWRRARVPSDDWARMHALNWQAD